jgi:hypothetical protein
MAFYFKTHIPNYSMLTADLHEMVRQDFMWDRDKWNENYDAKLEALKQGIITSAMLHFPDYSLQWDLRCDASNQACGGTILQELVDSVTNSKELQVIAFMSTQFSGSAALWPTNKTKCYSLYYSVKELSNFLQCKEFVLQTSRYNLLCMKIYAKYSSALAPVPTVLLLPAPT